MQNVYMDWGQGKKLQIVDSEGQPFPQQKSVFAFLDIFSPVRIFAETPMSCKHPEERNRILQHARALGSEILCVGARTSGTYRKLWGLEKTTDVEDARLLRRIALETPALFVPMKEVEIRPPSLQRRADALGRKGVTSYVGRYRTIPSLLRECFGNQKSFDPIAKLFVQAALESNSKQKFIKKVGAYGHGYPNLLRATFYRRVRTLAQRELKTKSYKTVPLQRWSEVFQRQQKILNKGLRMLYHRVKQTQVSTTATAKSTILIAIPASV